MAKTAKNILTLNHEEAMDFFMRSEQYHGNLVQFQSSLTREPFHKATLSTIGRIVWSNVPLNNHCNTYWSYEGEV